MHVVQPTNISTSSVAFPARTAVFVLIKTNMFVRPSAASYTVSRLNSVVLGTTHHLRHVVSTRDSRKISVCIYQCSSLFDRRVLRKPHVAFPRRSKLYCFLVAGKAVVVGSHFVNYLVDSRESSVPQMFASSITGS